MAFPSKVPNPPGTPVKRRQTDEGDAAGPGMAVPILKKIDEGSFYKVYLTKRNTVLRIAHKQCNAELECEILGRLCHPGINRMLGFWSQDGRMHFEMEYCSEGNLESMLERRSSSEPFLELFNQTANMLFGPVAEHTHDHDDASAVNADQIKLMARNTDNSNVLCDPFTDDASSSACNTSRICTDDESESAEAAFEADQIVLPHWIIRLMHDVSSGLAYIHSNNVVHMDIKPSNILLHREGESSVFKICDFNISRVGEGPVDLDGESAYMAPEILRNKAYFASDVYSLGLVYLVLCNPGRRLPRDGEDYRRLRRNNFGGWRIDEIGRMMLDRDPHKRCTAVDVREHFESLLR